MQRRLSPLKEYIQSEFLNDSGDRLFLFISGLCIFNGVVIWKDCRLLLITPQGQNAKIVGNRKTGKGQNRKRLFMYQLQWISLRISALPAGQRLHPPLVKHTVNDAVMQTCVHFQRQTIISSEAHAVRRGLGGRGCGNVRLSSFVPPSPVHTHTHTLRGAALGVPSRTEPIYQLSATKPLIQQILFCPKQHVGVKESGKSTSVVI